MPSFIAKRGKTGHFQGRAVASAPQPGVRPTCNKHFGCGCRLDAEAAENVNAQASEKFLLDLSGPGFAPSPRRRNVEPPAWRGARAGPAA